MKTIHKVLIFSLLVLLFSWGNNRQIYADNIEYKINAKDQKEIKSRELLRLYHERKQLVVEGKGYHYIIDGNDIENCSNVMETDINLKYDGKNITFDLNNGKYLCGRIKLYIDDAMKGAYLYLYNENKEIFERINIENMKVLSLSSPGNYMITKKIIKKKSFIKNKVMKIGGSIIFLGGMFLIITKKRYWFW